MKTIRNAHLSGERALFHSEGLRIESSRFCDGESPLKESVGLELSGCSFEWKYPLWYCRDVRVENTYVAPTARSGIWYTEGIVMTDCKIDAPKTFRRCEGVHLCDVSLLNAQETLWTCSDVTLTRVAARGDYFGMNCRSVSVDGLRLSGNYAFDGGRDIVVRNSVLYSKDAFWNCENVTVIDSVIVGEYLGWNSRNVKFVNCDVESNQGLCYMDGVTLEGCRFVRTDLAFEYSSVEADIRSHIDSVKNPSSGKIVADSIGEIIHESDFVDVSKTKIKVRND